jgi:hypothetical protein
MSIVSVRCSQTRNEYAFDDDVADLAACKRASRMKRFKRCSEISDVRAQGYGLRVTRQEVVRVKDSRFQS